MSAKMCIRCGQDCSNKPRTKDLQGNYTCRACFDKAQAAARSGADSKPSAPAPTRPAAPKAPPVRAAPAPAAHAMDDDAAVLAALLDGPDTGPAVMNGCPNCGSPLPEGGVICMICGYNKSLGKAVTTKKFAAPRETSERTSRQSGVVLDLLTAPWTIFIGLSLLYTGLFMVGMEDQTALMILLGCYVVGALVTFIYEIVAAFSDDDSVWGIVAICQIVPCVGGIAGLSMLYYVFAISERGRLKAMLGSQIVGAILVAVLRVQDPAAFEF